MPPVKAESGKFPEKVIKDSPLSKFSSKIWSSGVGSSPGIWGLLQPCASSEQAAEVSEGLAGAPGYPSRPFHMARACVSWGEINIQTERPP